MLSNNPKAQFDARLQAARRDFYGLQSSGMCESGVSPVVSAHMYFFKNFFNVHIFKRTHNKYYTSVAIY